MKVTYAFTHDGGFLANYAGTYIVAYAYPGSPYEEAANRHPEKRFAIARSMLEGERFPRSNAEYMLSKAIAWETPR